MGDSCIYSYPRTYREENPLVPARLTPNSFSNGYPPYTESGTTIMSPIIRNFLKSIPFFHSFLVSALVILLWLIPLAAMTLREEGHGAGIWGYLEIAAFLATILAPVVYGWKSCDTKGAILTGVLPFLFVMTVPRLLTGEVPWGAPWFVNNVSSTIVLCIIGGLEGYFASLQEKQSLVVAGVLAGLWIVVFLSGIN
jgi:hypothetical protein